MKQNRKYLFVLLIVFFVGIGWLYTSSKGHELRRMLAGSILSSQHPQFASFLLSKSEIDELEKVILQPPSKQSGTKIAVPNIKPFNIKIETVENENFTAKVMIVNDPRSVHLVSTKYLDKGQPLSELIIQNGAIAGINAGGFDDPGGQGSGGQIIGIAISDGKVKSQPGFNPNTPSLLCGFTNSGQFITGTYTIHQLMQMGVSQAVSFGPQILVNGQNVISDEIDEAFGWAPRTAIGQKNDGSVVMIITDGRFYWNKLHRGASMKDMAQLFQKYQAIDAFNLDGGGSTTMIYNNQLLLQPATNTDVGMRYLPNAFVVIPPNRTKNP